MEDLPDLSIEKIFETKLAIFKTILAIWTVTATLKLQPSPETFKNHWTSDF